MKLSNEPILNKFVLFLDYGIRKYLKIQKINQLFTLRIDLFHWTISKIVMEYKEFEW